MTYEDAMELYPNVPGCCSCIYWRGIGTGRFWNVRKINPHSPQSNSYPCCHYSIDHDYQLSRDSSEMGYECKYRVPRTRKKIKRKNQRVTLVW